MCRPVDKWLYDFRACLQRHALIWLFYQGLLFLTLEFFFSDELADFARKVFIARIFANPVILKVRNKFFEPELFDLSAREVGVD